jgi:hypothetical protein
MALLDPLQLQYQRRRLEHPASAHGAGARSTAAHRMAGGGCHARDGPTAAATPSAGEAARPARWWV